MISFFELEIPRKKKITRMEFENTMELEFHCVVRKIERYDKEIRRTCNALISETIKLYWAIDNSSN